MALDYLRFNIFGLALSDMATSTGSIKERLCGAYNGYFYKISWDKDLEFMPNEYKQDFLLLKKLMYDDVFEKIEQKRASLRTSHPEISEDLLQTICNSNTEIKSLHWRKAQKIAELISHIFWGLELEIKQQYKKQKHIQ